MSLSFFKSHQKNYINKPFDRLPLKQRAIFILHLAGFTQREIRDLLRTDRNLVSSAISMGFKEYGDDFKNIFPKSEGV